MNSSMIPPILAIILTALALFLPGGLLARFKRWRAQQERALFEDVLKCLQDCDPTCSPASLDSLRRRMALSRSALEGVLRRMEAAGLLEPPAEALRLTSEGRRVALRVIRAHRLWERYLADEARMPLDKVHHDAHRKEHSLTDEEIEALDAHLGHPASDPHGDPIPGPDGMIIAAGGKSILESPLNQPLRILHIEDEPEIAFKQILAEGLRPGMIVRIIENQPSRVILASPEDEYRLAPDLAALLLAAEIPPSDMTRGKALSLIDLQEGEASEIIEIVADCQGFTRRRLLDLGMTHGALVSVELSSAFGGPRAYRIRGTLVALRDDQASKVKVRKIVPGADSPEKSIHGGAPQDRKTLAA